jgi:hypothetical protein
VTPYVEQGMSLIDAFWEKFVRDIKPDLQRDDGL